MNRQKKLLATPLLFLALLVTGHLVMPGANFAGNLDPSQPPTAGTMHTLDEIYNAVTSNAATNHVKYVSAYVSGNGSIMSLMVVPADKTFIMTDCVGNVGANAEIHLQEKIGTTTQTKISFGSMATGGIGILDYHLRSGIPFAPGSEVLVSNLGNTARFFISGYLIDPQ
jgi:hypothetical protein